MAITYVGGASGTNTNGNNPSVSLTALTGGSDSAAAQNDLVIFSYGDPYAAADLDLATVGAGWTEIADLFANDTIDTQFGVFWKIMTATPDTSVVGVASTDAGSGTAGAVQVFRGIDLTTPFDVTSVPTTGLNTALPDPSSIDWSTSGVWTVIAAGAGHTQGAVTYTFPTGYTTDAVQAVGNDTNDISVLMGYNLAPADPENPGAFTWNGTDNVAFSWAAVTMALRPATGGSQFISVLVGV